MSSASSTVTYTSVDTDSEPGRAFWPADEELSDGGSPRVIVYGYDGLPIQPVAPPSPDYIPGPEDLQAHDPDYVPGPEEPEQAPLSPDYVPGPEYPEYLAPSDEEVPIEDQPYAVADSPIALSPGYVADSDPEEDPEEDSEDGPVDYPVDGGDDDDDDSSDDDKEEEEASKEEEASEAEEEHLAPADSVVAPIVDHVPSAEEAEPFQTDESAATPPSPPARRTTARI
ncbi:hypothetical protein Tco_0036870, partial [Tanacetum coccineum]